MLWFVIGDLQQCDCCLGSCSQSHLRVSASLTNLGSLVIRKFKVALNPMYRIFVDFAKSTSWKVLETAFSHLKNKDIKGSKT